MMPGDAQSDRLSEYIDGELSAEEAQALESHLEKCAACRATLEELRGVVARLSADPVTASDQPTLGEWLTIRSELRMRRRRWVIPTAVAAAGVAASIIVITTNGLLPLRGTEESGPARVSAPTAGPTGYREATQDLEAILRENRSRMNPQTLQAVDASLATLDSAIAQARQAQIAEPANDYVNRHVGELLDARLVTLRQSIAVARLRN